MRRKFNAWRIRRKTPVIAFGQTVRVKVGDDFHYMRLAEVTVDYTGASATLRPRSWWISKTSITP